MSKENPTDLPSHEILRQHLLEPLNKRTRKKKHPGELPPGKIKTKNGTIKKKIPKVYTLYKCSICKKEFSDKSNLTTHEKIHSTISPYECTLCSYKGKTKKYLSRHTKKVHREPTAHKCEFCGKMFHYKSNLTKHLRTHTGEKPYKCEICGKTFGVSYSLNTHLLIHSDQKPFQCSFCDYACRDSSTLRKHEGRHGNVQKMYKCKICHKGYKSKNQLKTHVTDNHLELAIKKLPCKICGQEFKNKATLTNHIKVVHEKSKGGTCAICGFYLSNKGNMPAHLRVHVDAKPYVCTYKGCSKRYKDTSSLRKHSLSHYPEKQFPCAICGKLFTRRRRAELHVRRHLPRRRCVECDHCGATFYNKTYLATHIHRKHGKNKKKYECDVCGFITYNKPSLVMHLKYGHGYENDRQCKICRKIYKKHIYLKMHYWKSHSIKYSRVHYISKKGKDKKPPVEIKIEPIEAESYEEIELLDIHKVEIGDSTPASPEPTDSLSYSRGVLSEDISRSILENQNTGLKMPEEKFDEFFIEHIFAKQTEVMEKSKYHIDKEEEQYAKQTIDKLLVQCKRRKQLQALERVRQQYNERIKNATNEASKKEKVSIKYFNKTADDNETTESVNDDSNDAAKYDGTGLCKLKLNTHQCYICFKLYETKPKLIQHCQEHFDICNDTTLTKCPLCSHVTKNSIVPHMQKIHRVNLKVPYNRIQDRKDNTDGSRYCYDINGTIIEIIPSVKILNKQASIEIEKKTRETKNKFIAKTKLVRKGNEWIVEKEKIDVSNDFILPKFDEDQLKYLKVVGDNYVDRMKNLSILAKRSGKKMMFPCNKCEKICQTLSALKLHGRKHEENPKPFKPKQYKRKSTKPIIVKEKNDNVNLDNRLAKPKPIINKHKCDQELIDFYESNIRGGDIEFWQFLKIFNKMGRENVTDFKDLESRTDFGIHFQDSINKTSNEPAAKVKKMIKLVKQSRRIINGSHKRVIMISRKEFLRRNKLIAKLRQKIANELHNK